MVAELGCSSAASLADALAPPITEEIVKAVKSVLQEQFSERIRKQIVDVRASQAVDQVTEVPKTSSRDRTSQRTVEQIFNVPVPEMVTQLVEVPNTVSQERVQQRTVEHIAVDTPVPQDMEEPARFFKVFSQDRIQQRTVEQIIPATSFDEKIVELPVIQTEEKTQQGVNTHAQHVVNTVEVEKPKIIELTVQRKKHTIQEKINQVSGHVETPLCRDGDVCVCVGAKSGITWLMNIVHQIKTHGDPEELQIVEKIFEIPELQFTGEVVDIPVVTQRQKTMEISQLQVDVPVVAQRQNHMAQTVQMTTPISSPPPVVKELPPTTVQGGRMEIYGQVAPVFLGTAPPVAGVGVPQVMAPPSTTAGEVMQGPAEYVQGAAPSPTKVTVRDPQIYTAPAAPAPQVKSIVPAPAVVLQTVAAQKPQVTTAAIVYQEGTVTYTAPAPVMTVTTMAPAMPATTVVATPAPVVEYITPAPAVYIAPAPVAEYMGPAPAITCAHAALVVECISPAPAVSYV